jgi:hypothetical protein
MELRLTTASRARHAAARRLRHSGRERPRMKPYKFQALVMLYPPEDGGLNAEPPLHVRHLTVRATNRETHQSRIFSALVSAVDGSPLRPGSADIVVTMVVLGHDVRDYLAPGADFALLSGSEVGHGVVSRRMFT